MILAAHSENWKERDTKTRTIYSNYLQKTFDHQLRYDRQSQPRSSEYRGTQRSLPTFVSLVASQCIQGTHTPYEWPRAYATIHHHTGQQD